MGPVCPVYYRPGQQSVCFTILRRRALTTSGGRVYYEHAPAGTVVGMLMRASQSERVRWAQVSHAISHAITVFGRTEAQAGDILQWEGRRFTIQGKEEPGGIFSVLACEERLGGSKQ